MPNLAIATASKTAVSIPPPPKKPIKHGPRAYRADNELWDYKDRFIAWMKNTGYSPVSVKGAHADLSWFLRWLEPMNVVRVADITAETLEHYSFSLRELRNGLPPSPGHVARRLYSLKNFFKWLMTEAAVLYDPAEDLELPKLPQELPHTILDQKEVRRFLDAPNLRSPVGYRDKALLELAYGSGVRTAELVGLKTSAIDVKRNVVIVRQGKGRKDGEVPVPPLTMLWVKEYIEKVRPAFAARRRRDDGTLWLNYTGGVLDKNRLVGVFKHYRQVAGLDKHVTTLTLRHSIASHLLENGMDIRSIQVFMRHEKLSTTQIYSKVTLTGLDKHYRRAHPRERAWAKEKK